MRFPTPQFLCIAAVAALAPTVAVAQSADKPALHPGDSWTYQQLTDGKESTWTRKVLGVGADGTVDMQIGERPFKVDASLNVMDPKGPAWSRAQYKFPMQSGSEWSFTTKVMIAQNEVDQRNKYKVVAYEPLTVPAGTFDCYRVEGTSELNLRQSYSRQVRETYWYCPKVASFAKMTREVNVTARDTPSSREKTEIVLVKYAGKG